MKKKLKKVSVLVSTYNGEKYIAEQLDCIFNQTYNNIDIYVRDDGSKDKTPEILEKYSKEGKIIYIKDKKNLGYPEAFYELMRKVKKSDYYSFSDQDDIWYEDKIERGVKVLEESNPDKPALFFANYDVCDMDLNHIRTSIGPNRNPDFRYSLFSSIGLGFTYILNHKAMELALSKRSVKTVTKDVWIGMLSTAFGKAYYDSKPCANHRRNPGAYSSQDTKFWSTQKDRFTKFFKNNGFDNIYNVMKEFYDMFKNKLSSEDKKTMELFLYRGYNPIKYIKKIFYPHRLRYDFKDELMLRIIFLIRKL